MQYLIDSHQVMQNLNKKFEDSFIEPTIQENLFLVMTGIETNFKSIKSYVELKNSLGDNYTWRIIKSAKPHLKFDDNGKLFIKLSKIQKIYRDASLITSLLLFFVGIFLLYYLSKFDTNSVSEILLVYIIVFPFFLFAYFLVYSIKSIIDANIILKKLNKK